MAFESSLGRAREFSDNLKARARISAAAERTAKANSSAGLLPAELGGNSPLGSTGRSSGNDAELLRHNVETAAACVRLIASRCAGQPLLVGQKAPGGTKNASPAGAIPIANHPLAEAWANPNETITGWGLAFSFIASLELAGRAFIWLRMNGTRLELWPLSPAWVRRPIAGQGSKVRSAWEVQPPNCGEAFQIANEDMLFAAYPDPQDPVGDGGLSPLAAAMRSVQANEQIIESQADAFSGIFPRHAIIVGKEATGTDGAGKVVGQRPRLTPAQQQQIISGIKRRYAGMANQNEPMILDSLVEDVKVLSHSPRELDFGASAKLTEQRVYRAYGINEISLGAVENANRASAAIADYQFCSRVNATLSLVSQCVDQWVGVRFGDQRLTAWFQPCEPVDPEHELAVVEKLAGLGCISRNEIRAKFGYSPIVGGDAIAVPFTSVDAPIVPLKSLAPARVFARAPSGKLLEIVEPEGTADE